MDAVDAVGAVDAAGMVEAMAAATVALPRLSATGAGALVEVDAAGGLLTFPPTS